MSLNTEEKRNSMKRKEDKSQLARETINLGLGFFWYNKNCLLFS